MLDSMSNSMTGILNILEKSGNLDKGILAIFLLILIEPNVFVKFIQ